MPSLSPIVALLVTFVGITTTRGQTTTNTDDWPRHISDYAFEIVKDPNASPTPFEEWDVRWFHLHLNHSFLPDALANTIAPRLLDGYDTIDPPILDPPLDLEVRYTVKDVPVSDWMTAPFRFELRVDNPGLLQDGVHAMTIEARGADRLRIQPVPAFVHVTRGDSYVFNRSVPIINAFQGYPRNYFDFGPDIVYVNPDDRNHVGYPADPKLTSWSTPPTATDLFQEIMGPHSELFHAMQMWWDHPAHENAPFVRGIPPQHGEDHRGLRVGQDHQKFPMMDGPRGVGWMSAYVSGQVDSQGRLAFAETGGRVGYLMPDGEIITIAGWRVMPSRDPIWWKKPLAAVRQNMENVGSWMDGRGEFFTPLDVAIDPQDESILYVVGYEDHVIWRIAVPNDIRSGKAVISILAGDPNHGSGFLDGTGSAARFDGPASLVFDPVADVLYVADQDNDAVRRVTRAGVVTTVAGQPGMRQRLTDDGVSWNDQLAARGATQFETTAGQQPDIYMPQCIRVDSQGRIILLEVGYGALRRIDPNTLLTETIGEVRQKHREWDRGWAWFDVDRYGNSGLVDGIYWTKFVNTLPGEHFSEVYRWLGPGADESVNLFSSPTGLYPDGWGPIATTNPPHYGWLVAVDPRGGVLLAGGGEHGVTRLRMRRDTDPTFSLDDYWLGRWVYRQGVPTDSNGASEYRSRSLSLRFGWHGHNMLGLPDVWSMSDLSDDELLDALQVDNLIRNDTDSLREFLAYVRPNTYGAVDTMTVSPVSAVTPVPTTLTPTISPTSTPVAVPATPSPSNQSPTAVLVRCHEEFMLCMAGN